MRFLIFLFSFNLIAIEKDNYPLHRQFSQQDLNIFENIPEIIIYRNAADDYFIQWEDGLESVAKDPLLVHEIQPIPFYRPSPEDVWGHIEFIQSSENNILMAWVVLRSGILAGQAFMQRFYRLGYRPPLSLLDQVKAAKLGID